MRRAWFPVSFQLELPLCGGMEIIMKKMRFAIIGYGGQGSWHANRLIGKAGSDLNRDYFDVAGVYDINPEKNKQAEENGFSVYRTFEEVLADASANAAVVATPNDVHKELCIALMDAGKHVVCEKPVAMNVAELDEMLAAAKRNNVVFSVHQNRRWDPDYLNVRHVYESGKLGDVFCIESRVHGSRGIPGDWRNEKVHGGGMVFDWGIHLFDQMLYWMDSPIRSIYAVMNHVTNGECDDGFKVITQFENGIQYHAEVGTSNFINMPRWYMLGCNGTAIMTDWGHESGKIVTVTDWENKDAVPIMAGAGLTKTMAPRDGESTSEYPFPDLWKNASEYFVNFAKACDGEEELIVTHAQMRRVMKFVEACFESYEQNKVITDFEKRCLQ